MASKIDATTKPMGAGKELQKMGTTWALGPNRGLTPVTALQLHLMHLTVGSSQVDQAERSERE
jgi:hypothetical protein